MNPLAAAVSAVVHGVATLRPAHAVHNVRADVERRERTVREIEQQLARLDRRQMPRSA